MVKKIDSTGNYKKAFLGFAACVVAAGICIGIHVGICKFQHDHMYDKVKNTGFIKEENPDFIARILSRGIRVFTP